MRDRRLPVSLAAVSLLAVVVVLGLASSGAIVASVHAAPQAPATPTPAPTNQSPSQTLVIEQVNGSVGYTVTVAGTLTFRQEESGDSIARQTATGQVGGFPWQERSNDTTDVIHFTGTVQNFEYNGGELRVVRDGNRVDPDSLRNTPLPPGQTPTQPQSPSPHPPSASPSPSPTTGSSPTIAPSPIHASPGTTPGTPTDDGSAPTAHGENLFTQLVRSIGGFIIGIAIIGGVLSVVRGRTE